MKGGLGLHFLHVFIQSFIYIFGIFLAKTKEKTGPQHFLYISYLATLGFYSLRILEIISFFTPSSKLYFSFPLPSSQRHHRLTYGLNPQNKVSCSHWCNNRQRHWELLPLEWEPNISSWSPQGNLIYKHLITVNYRWWFD